MARKKTKKKASKKKASKKKASKKKASKKKASKKKASKKKASKKKTPAQRRSDDELLRAVDGIRQIADASEDADAFLARLASEVTTLIGEYKATRGPQQHRRSVRARVDAWLRGELEVARAPELTDEQQAELRTLVDRTTITAVDASAPDGDLQLVTIAFTIGGWSATSEREYSFARERSWATIGKKLYSSMDVALNPAEVNTKALDAAMKAIPTTLPREAALLYLVLVAFDDELFMRWSPWIDSLDLSRWPPR